MDYSYLVPPQEVQNIQHSDHYIIHGTREKAARKIYEFVRYTPFEEEKIKELKEEIQKQKIELSPDWKESDYLKIGYSGRFKMKDVIKKLRDNIQWRINPIYHNINSHSEKFLKDGIVYIYGRDKEFRPIVILNAYKIDTKKYDKECVVQALSFALGVVRNYMFVPGKVENWMFLLETNEIGVFGLPLKALGVVIDTMTVNFAACLEKMFILNPSSGLNFVWSTISGWLDEETRLKINFVTKKNMKTIQQFIPQDQLEQKYGGTKPNQTVFWPPYNLDLPDGYTKKVPKQELQIIVEEKQEIRHEEQQMKVEKQELQQVKQEEKKEQEEKQEQIPQPQQQNQPQQNKVQERNMNEKEEDIYDQVTDRLNDFLQQNYQMYANSNKKLNTEQQEEEQKQENNIEKSLEENQNIKQSQQGNSNNFSLNQAFESHQESKEIKPANQNEEQQQLEKADKVVIENQNEIENELLEKKDTQREQINDNEQNVAIVDQPESEPPRQQDIEQEQTKAEQPPEIISKVDPVVGNQGCCTSLCSIF